MGRLRRLLLTLCCVLLASCAARRTGEVVRRITFVVEGRPFPSSLWLPQSNRALRKVMAQRVSSWQSLLFPGVVEPAWLDRGRLRKDEQRLEIWFAEHGYFDANVTGWEVTPRPSARETGRRGIRPVTVRVFIDQQEASRVRAVTISGLEGVRRGVARRARAAAQLEPGSVFSTDDQTAAVTAIRDTLLAGGYATARVSGRADAWPDAHAVDVTIDVKPGMMSYFGPITIVGAEGMPTDIVADTVAFEEGDRFSPRALSETRTAFFGLRVFSVVNVTPQLEDPGSTIVPVTITVKPTKWRRLKLGPGLALETGKGALYASAEWEHNNLFHRLWHFEQKVKAGAAGVVLADEAPGSLDASQVTVAPIVDASTALTIPHVFGKDWSLEVDGRVQVGIEPGYRFFSPELAPSLIWRPTERLDLAFGYRIRSFDYFDFTIDIQDILDSPLGLDLTDPYLLSMLEQRLTWDSRDDPMAPKKGLYTMLSLAEAGGPAQGNFDFIRGKGEVRAYLSAPKLGRWRPRLVLATRLGAGVILPYGDGPEAAVPFAERLYLGGGTTVRGWSSNRLGPSTTTTDRETGETALVPAGGLFDALGNLELRKGLPAGFTVAAFTDAGRVWPTLAGATFDGVQWSVGGGLRYATAIGPVRADVGVRLGDDPVFALQPRWALHLGLSEAF